MSPAITRSSLRRGLHVLAACGALAGAALAGDKLADAREQLSAGEFDKAAAMLKGMLDAHEGDAGAVRLLLAQAQRQAGTPEAAVETLDPLSDSKDYEVVLELGRSYRAMGDKFAAEHKKSDDIGFAYDQARSYLELAAKVAPAGNATAAIEAGNFDLYVLGDFETAMSLADGLLEKKKDDGEALLLRGCAGVYAVVAAQNAGDADQAAKANDRAVQDLLAADKQLAKERYEPWVQLTWLYETGNKPVDAVNAAIEVLKRYPKADFASLYHLGKRYATERRYDAASKALLEMAHRDAAQFGRWIDGETDKAAVATTLGYAIDPLATANPPRAAEAADILGAIVAVQKADADLWNNYALMCRDAQRFDESYRGYSEALKLLPEEPALYNDAAVILHYYLHRDYGKAQELYEQAIDLADAELARTDLPADRRKEIETVKKDASKNMQKLASKDYTWNG